MLLELPMGPYIAVAAAEIDFVVVAAAVVVVEVVVLEPFSAQPC